MDSRSNNNFDLTRVAMASAKRGSPARTHGGVFEGAPGILEREHWEFSFDGRPTNRTWAWRQVGDKGYTVRKSAAFADLKLAVDDAVRRGFSPAEGNWVVRGVPITMRAALRRALSG